MRRVHGISRRFCTNISAAKGYKQAIAHYTPAQHTLSGLPDISRPFTVLGIETSCDDTCVGIVRSDGTILANVVKSQTSLHAAYGGVVPNLARHAHQDAMQTAISEALLQAQMTMDDIDGIAVTRGPGLALCLRVGSRAARALARQYNKPFVTIHHLEAHCAVAGLAGTSLLTSKHAGALKAPYLCLLASGGHTSLLIVKEDGSFDILGGTIDDAIGEAFDKSARLLGISSGGAGIESAATSADRNTYSLPVPLRYRTSCDFSFSGLKNSFRLIVDDVRGKYGLRSVEEEEQCENKTPLPPREVSSLAAAFQDAALSHIGQRIVYALKYIYQSRALPTGDGTLVVVGGVAANMELRSHLIEVIEAFNRQYAMKWDVIVPPPTLCTDNGVMVAWSAVEKFQRGVSDLIEEEKQDVIARWPLGPHIGIEVETVLKRLKDDVKAARRAKYSTCSISSTT